MEGAREGERDGDLVGVGAAIMLTTRRCPLEQCVPTPHKNVTVEPAMPVAAHVVVALAVCATRFVPLHDPHKHDPLV